MCGGVGRVGPSSLCERYSFAGKKWEWLPNLPIGVWGASAVAVGGQWVLVIGGETRQGWSSGVFRLDTTGSGSAGWQWEELAPMASGRSVPGALARAGGVGPIVVTGGWVGGEGVSSSCEQYDPPTNTWSPFPTMQRPRANHQLVECGGQLFAIGGWGGSDRLDTVERFDDQSSQWVLIDAKLPLPLKDFAAVEL